MLLSRPAVPNSGFWTYENRLVLILGLAQGCQFFDRLAFNFLSPVIMQDLRLTNSHIGLLAVALSVSWASSGYVVGLVADRPERRKLLLVIAVIAFSLASALSGFARSFASLLAARVILGFTEGPIVPLSMTLMANASTPRRRGLNMGLVQNFCTFLIGQFVGAIVSTQLANLFGWRLTFFIAAVPGLIVASLLWRWIHPDSVTTGEPPKASPAKALSGQPAKPLTRQGMNAMGLRNLVLCMCIATCIGSWMVLQITFLPVYLTRSCGLSMQDMGFVMSMMGLSGVVASIVVPLLSDRFGRKPVMILAAITGVITPLSILYLKSDPVILSVAMFFGSMTTGSFPLYISIIPSESLPLSFITRSIGLTNACAELFGGAVVPALTGYAADQLGLGVVIWGILAVAVTAILLSLFLIESAPSKRQQS